MLESPVARRNVRVRERGRRRSTFDTMILFLRENFKNGNCTSWCLVWGDPKTRIVSCLSWRLTITCQITLIIYPHKSVTWLDRMLNRMRLRILLYLKIYSHKNRIASVMESDSMFKLRYLRFHVISDRVMSSLEVYCIHCSCLVFFCWSLFVVSVATVYNYDLLMDLIFISFCFEDWRDFFGVFG